MRYYYKSKSGNGFLKLKTPLNDNSDYVEITEQEFNELTKQPELTAEQIAEMNRLTRIAELKSLLSKTDYQALKYFEGWLTDEEYAPIKAQRQAYRDEINTLEAKAQR